MVTFLVPILWPGFTSARPHRKVNRFLFVHRYKIGICLFPLSRKTMSKSQHSKHAATMIDYQGLSKRQRTTGKGDEDAIMGEDDSDGSETQPSGDFSEHDDYIPLEDP